MAGVWRRNCSGVFARVGQPRKIGETLVALANAHGGALLLGVSATGQAPDWLPRR